MNSRINPPLVTVRALTRMVAVLAVICCAFSAQLRAQTTPGGTVISNQASATYSDGTNNYATVSNTVTVTVANVAGLTITPDGAPALANVAPGQSGVLYTFTVTNTGNFADQVRFETGGASVRVVGPGTITAAVIDVDGSGTINAGDTNIFSNGAPVDSAAIAAGSSIAVLVSVNVNAAATAGQTVQVILGDAAGPSPYDDRAYSASANDVHTVSATPVNGQREARGDNVATVEDDAILNATVTAPAGPVALGSDITLTLDLSNPGSRTAAAQTFAVAPAGLNTGVFVVATVTTGTVVSATNVFPAGTLYSTGPVAQDAVSTATWTNVQPPLASITRIAFNVGATLAAGASAPSQTLILTVQSNINAGTPLSHRVDGYAKNSLGADITDSGTATTTLAVVGAVLIGPSGAAGAVGPTNNNDDYTNKSTNTGINVPPGDPTTAAGTVVFVNTVQNTGNTNDTYTIDAPTVPAGFTVEISTDGGATYTDVSAGGSVALAVSFTSSANISVRVTAPAGQTVLTAFDTVIRATSGNDATATNNTIDRFYTGFVELTKARTINNTTGVGGATDPVPGAEITYTITYRNVSVGNGGAGCVNLTVSNLVITEDGTAGTNNWGTYTTHVVGAADSTGGTITGDVAGSNLLTDTVASLAPGASGTFTFKRVIN